MVIENKYWAKEIVQRTKKRDDIVNNRFNKNKINQLSLIVAQASASISDLKTQLRTYLPQVPSYQGPRSAMDAMAQGTSTSSTTESIVSKIVRTSLAPDRVREKVEQSKNCKADESMISQHETLYQDVITREYELITNEINEIINDLSKQNDEDEASNAALIHYHQLREKRLKLEAEQSVYFFIRAVRRERNQQSRRRRRRNNPSGSYSNVGRGLLSSVIINEANTRLTEEYHELFKLDPRFIYNDPKTTSRQRTTEVATLKRKIENRLFEKKVRPGHPVEQFIAALDKMLLKLRDSSSIDKHQTTLNNNNKQFFFGLCTILIRDIHLYLFCDFCGRLRKQ
ncbi:unnamed protein product [Rotaria magnacalcarata]|uniref:Uncharacterized protein n=1 Tax=Rotaria magnacalcarata TaxID=392030 RepID=A0A816FH38_9BILA|nr:unnamed protein product [Rotaria magnacalcarata]CAF1661405.1 unnamed protein product [Rotaria magnacalcarata]CAF3876192.1 unnamed protein product [Rotaria magnacalcarata]CAF4057422.1 unnamed protein product [Rotaria magnacalcarata]CAF4089073.1 unnamed protein product [Rotaria magnacalcarata]